MVMPGSRKYSNYTLEIKYPRVHTINVHSFTPPLAKPEMWIVLERELCRGGPRGPEMVSNPLLSIIRELLGPQLAGTT